MRQLLLLLCGTCAILTACAGGTTTVPTATTAARGNSPPPTTAPAATRTVAPTLTSTTNRATPAASAPPGTPAATATRGSATPGTPGTPSLPEAPPVAFQTPPWSPGERTTYSVTARDGGQTVGNATFALGREFEAETISATFTINEITDRFQIGFDTKSFMPVSELRTITTPQGTIDIRAEFHAGGATIEVINRQGNTRQLLTLPPTYYANDQFLVITRALPFAEGYRGSLRLVPSQGDPATISAVVTVVGKETVETPRGTISCWKVEARFEGTAAAQFLWFSVETPNYLVKYDNGRFIYLLSQVR